MNKLTAGIIVAAAVLSIGTLSSMAAGEQNRGGRCGQTFVDANGDGICDNRGSAGCGFVDANGDGICDNGNGTCSQNGKGACYGRNRMK